MSFNKTATIVGEARRLGASTGHIKYVRLRQRLREARGADRGGVRRPALRHDRFREAGSRGRAGGTVAGSVVQSAICSRRGRRGLQP